MKDRPNIPPPRTFSQADFDSDAAELNQCQYCGGTMRVYATTTRALRIRYRKCIECGVSDNTVERREEANGDGKPG